MGGYAWHDVLGNLGVLLILGTYAALQLGRVDAAAMRYSALNALGAGLITLSLLFDFNLSAFVVGAGVAARPTGRSVVTTAAARCAHPSPGRSPE
jgi:hypothetical protein